MADPVSLTVSVLSLTISSVTAWLTLFRRANGQFAISDLANTR